MKRILLVLCLIISFQAFSQTNTLSWYKMFRGKIDKYPVTLHLHKAGHDYFGYYYYESQQKPVYFFGDDTTLKDRIQILSYANPEEAESFIFSIVSNNIIGDWKKNEKATALDFSATEANMPVKFTYVFTNGSTKLRPKWKESPEAKFSGASVWPIGKSVSDEFLKTEIRHAFAEKNTGEEIGAMLLKQKKAFLTSYITDNKDIKDDELKETSMGYNMDEDCKMLVVFYSPKMITLAFTMYSYTGGAHGNYGTTYSSIDLTTNKTLTLDNIITEGGKKQLRTLLEKNFRKQYGLKPTETLTDGGLFEDKIEANENFYVTGKGIGFCYNPYEIGPYVMGEIAIFIPFTDLKSFLKEGFKNLIE